MCTHQTERLRHFSIFEFKLDTGERLPCLVDSATGLPCRVATRWVVRYRRMHTQSSTLVDNLRVLGRLYDWASNRAAFDLDTFLTTGNTLRASHIQSLATWIRGVPPPTHHQGRAVSRSGPMSAGAFNHHLQVMENFLVWALDCDNRGGGAPLTLTQLAAERFQLHTVFRSYHSRAQPPQRYEPLDATEIEAIRAVLKPRRDANGSWVWPEPGFSIQTRLRNWLMVETALQLGLRRGELLKLRLDSLPSGRGDSLRVMRYADDRHDARVKEPAVKTAERILPLPDPQKSNLRLLFRTYLTSSAPLGRVKGKTPYLFVAQWGDHAGAPLSKDAADDIIQQLGLLSGVPNLSWHRLRHTWAECMAEMLLTEPDGKAALMRLGGWTNELSLERYIGRAREKRANDFLRTRHSTLYDPEA